MSEDQLSTEFNKHLKPLGHIDDIESHASSPGIPDKGFCIRGIEGYVELKHTDDDNAPRIRPTQLSWFRRRVENGGRCYLLAKLKDVHVLFDGKHVADLGKLRKTSHWLLVPHVRKWHGSCNWRELAAIIACRKR